MPAVTHILLGTPLVLNPAKPGRRLTLQCSQTQPKIAAYFDLFKWRDLADIVENTLATVPEHICQIIGQPESLKIG